MQMPSKQEHSNEILWVYPPRNESENWWCRQYGNIEIPEGQEFLPPADAFVTRQAKLMGPHWVAKKRAKGYTRHQEPVKTGHQIRIEVQQPLSSTSDQVLLRQSGHEFGFGLSFLLDSCSCRHEFSYGHPEWATTHVVNIYCIEELN